MSLAGGHCDACVPACLRACWAAGAVVKLNSGQNQHSKHFQVIQRLYPSLQQPLVDFCSLYIKIS